MLYHSQLVFGIVTVDNTVAESNYVAKTVRYGASAPLKLRPYGAIEICLLLLLFIAGILSYSKEWIVASVVRLSIAYDTFHYIAQCTHMQCSICLLHMSSYFILGIF